MFRNSEPIQSMASKSSNCNSSNCAWACIRKKFAPGKVFSLQFMCMDTILRNTEHTIEKDMKESRTTCNLENCTMRYRKTSLFELISMFYTARSLQFTPSVYLFMVFEREDLRSMYHTEPCGFSYQLDEYIHELKLYWIGLTRNKSFFSFLFLPQTLILQICLF